MADLRNSYDHIFKILLVGNTGVGKTCLMTRYTKNTFTLQFISSIGVDFLTKPEDFDGHSVIMQIWDTAGQPKYHTITTSYYRGAQGIIIVYDITNRETFESVQGWYEEVRAGARKDAPILLIGNKSDLDDARDVYTEEAQELADHLGVKLIETSCKEDNNVAEAFHEMGQSIYDQHRTSSFQKAPPVVIPENTRKVGKCCSLM